MRDDVGNVSSLPLAQQTSYLGNIIGSYFKSSILVEAVVAMARRMLATHVFLPPYNWP